jgi:calpain
VCGRHKLAPGHYVIIPSTFKPNQDGEFLVRIFSEEPTASGELDEVTGIMPEEDDKTLEDLMKPGYFPGADVRRRRQRARQVTEDDVAEERQARVVFRKNAGEDLEVDAFELKALLNNLYMAEFTFDGFSLDTARSMVAMMDVDKSGKLGYEEFKHLWDDLRTWKKIFREFDTDGSGNLNSFELRQALNSAGIKVSNSTFNALVMRYSDKEGKILFDDFIQCAMRIKTMFDTWMEMAEGSKGPAKFELDAFIQTTMYS